MAGIELPEYMRIKSKSSLRVYMGSEWEEPKWYTVTISDVIRYYHVDARNISSGGRCIGRICGDWRNIDYIAKECLEVFKQINRKGLERAAKRYGMTLKE